MPIDLGQQCFDANDYLCFGSACALRVGGCWDPLRPIGAGLYFSLPFRLGLLPGSVIFLNILMLLAAAWAAVSATLALLDEKGPLSRALPWILQGVIYTWLVGKSIANSLSDAPAAALVTTSMWVLVIAQLKGKRRIFAASGALLAAGVLVRAFYLYPALLSLGALFVLTLTRRASREQFACFAAACLLPIALQYAVTHARTGAWTFIDQRSIAAGESEHFRNAWYGYDTVVGPERSRYYSAAECFTGREVMIDAVEKRDVRALGCLLLRRQWFYLGSFVPDGATYLSRVAERRFSYGYLVANSLVLACGAFWALKRVRRRILAVPLLFAGSVWAEASLILPESRFMLAFHALLWTMASAAAYDVLSSRFPLLFRSRAVPAMHRLCAALARGLSTVKSWFTRVDRRIFGALAVGAAAIVEAPVLSSDFIAEDLRSLYLARSPDTYGALTEPCGGHFCGGFRVAAASLHRLFGLQAGAYFFVVLLTHLVSVALLFRVLEALGATKRVAAIAAGFWGTIPFFQETLVRFSEYSQVIGVAATLWAVFEVAYAAETERPPTTWGTVRANFAVVVGATADRGAAIAAVFFPMIAYLITRTQFTRRRSALSFLPGAALAFASILFDPSKGSVAGPGHAWTIRYLYASSVGLVVAAALSLHKVRAPLVWPRTITGRRVLAVFFFAWIAACTFIARNASLAERTRREQTRDWGEIAIGVVKLFLGRIPSNDPLYVRNDTFRPAEPMYSSGVPRRDFPGIGAYWILSQGTGPVGRRPIRFVEEDQQVLEAIRKRSDSSVASLFLSREEVDRVHGTVRKIADGPRVMTFYFGLDPFKAQRDLVSIFRIGIRLILARRTMPWEPGQAVTPPPAPPILTQWDPEDVMYCSARRTPEVMRAIDETINRHP